MNSSSADLSPFAESDLAVWVTDAQGHCRYANHAACQLSRCRQGCVADIPPEQASALQQMTVPLPDGGQLLLAHDNRQQQQLQLQLQQALLHGDAKYQQIFNHVAVGVLHFDVNGISTDCNDSLVQHLKLARTRLIGLNLLQLGGGELRAAVQSVLDGKRSLYEGHYTIEHSGQILALRAKLIPIIVSGVVSGGIALVENMDAQRLAEGEHRVSRQRARLLRDQTALGMIEWDADFRVRDWNPAAEQIFGYSREQALGQHAHFILAKQQRELIHTSVLEALLQQRGGSRSQNANQTRDGCIIECEWFNTTLVDESGRTLGVTSLIQDVTESKRAEQQLLHLARHDQLTGLLNRAALAGQVQEAIEQTQPDGSPLALVFIDLDGFKHINDSLGHRAGDSLLCQQARRLSMLVRRGDSVARLGGDEFMLLLPQCDAAAAAELVQRLSGQLAQPCMVEGGEISVTSSMGIALYPQDGTDFDTLLRCADMAMYRAKRDGRNTWRGFQPDMLAQVQRRLRLENALRRALENNELMLYYQPQLEIGSGRLVGLEALLRWQHPELGWISPAEFIPVAEECGMIIPIGEWVLCEALSQLQHWQQASHPLVRVAVNLSAGQFQQANFAQRVQQLLETYAVPARLLELELTESVAMCQPALAVSIMDALNVLGVKVSIDDFGTGYSSLSYLRRLPLDTLKIDRSFVADIVEDKEDRAIIQAIISLAQTLGLKTLAEGVETEAQLKWLQQYGCDKVQGYYFSRPLPAAEIPDWLRRSAAALDAAATEGYCI